MLAFPLLCAEYTTLDAIDRVHSGTATARCAQAYPTIANGGARLKEVERAANDFCAHELGD
jgi:hypothetical protein